MKSKNEYRSISVPYGKLEQVPDSFQAYLVEGAKFTAVEEYPIIPCDFIPTEIPKRYCHFKKPSIIRVTYRRHISVHTHQMGRLSVSDGIQENILVFLKEQRV